MAAGARHESPNPTTSHTTGRKLTMALLDESIRHPPISVEEFVQQVLERMERDEGRPVDYYRIKELTPSFSKAWVMARVHDGNLKAVRLMGLTLITGKSLRAFLASTEPWTPR
jgi:hypothetical protein